MKKYKVILLILTIGFVLFTGFIIYENHFKPWKEAEEYINKYMVEQGITKDDISKITKEKAKKLSYNGIIYRVSYKDDSQYEYQYFYSDDIYALHKIDKVILQIYDLNNENKPLERVELKKVKYPPTYLSE